MKKSTQKAFTLVELIVVITILAILATVAYISLGGNVQKAKNTKITEDLNNLTRKINIITTQDKTLSEIITESTYITTSNNGVIGGTVNSGSILANNDFYRVGSIDFVALGEKGSDFQDNDGNDYVFAYVVDKEFVKFEGAGNILDQAGNPSIVLKGNYYPVIGSDVAGLISGSGTTNTGSVTTGNTVSLYQ